MSLKKQLIRIAQERGFDNLTEFINAWIRGGETFQSLHAWLRYEHGIKRHFSLVWKICRPYLTIPYGYDDAFKYKWEAIAKAKGYDSVDHMLRSFKRHRLCYREIAEELGIPNPKKIGKLLERLSTSIPPTIGSKIRTYRRRPPDAAPFKSSDRDGIVFKHRRDYWRQKLDEYGFRSLRDAVWKLKRKGLNYTQMAKLFGISPRGFRYRRRRAKLIVRSHDLPPLTPQNKTNNENSQSQQTL